MISKLKTNEWILITLFIASPLYFHTNLGGTGLNIPNNILIWSVASFFIFLSVFKLTKSKIITVPKPYLAILTFPLIAWFSSIFAGVEIFRTMVISNVIPLGGSIIFFALFQQRFKQSQWDKILLALVVAGILHSFVGLAQIIFVENLPSWIPINYRGDPTGFFQQINNQASFQVTVLLIALWLNTRPFIRSRHWLFYTSLIAIFLSGFIVAYSGSRVGVLSFLIATPLLVFSRWRYIKKYYKKWLVIFIALTISVLTANFFEKKSGLMSVAQKTAALNAGYSASARIGIYSIAGELILEKPISGHGIGSFVRVWQNKKPQFFEEHPDAILPGQRVGHPHNELMFWLVEGGISTGIGLTILFIAVILSILKLPKDRSYAYIALLTPIALHTQVELPFYSSSLHWFVFLTLLAYCLYPRVKTIEVNISIASQSLIRIITFGSSLIAIVFFIHSYLASLELRDYKYVQKQKTYATLESMQIALNNPYFKDIATNLVMVALYNTSLKKGIDSNIEIFAEWAEESINNNPHPNLFQLAIDSNLYMKKYEKLCQINHKAIAMYPRNERFNEIKTSCLDYQNKFISTAKHNEQLR